MSLNDIKSMKNISNSIPANQILETIKERVSLKNSGSTDTISYLEDSGTFSKNEATKEKLKTDLDNYFYNRLIELDKKLINLDIKFDNKSTYFEKSLKDSTNKGLETIGIFAAVLAVIIINVKVIESANSFLAAMTLMTSLTSTMIIFTSMIHFYLSPNDKKSLGYGFWIPMTFNCILIFTAIITHIYGKDICRTINIKNTGYQKHINDSNSIRDKPSSTTSK